MWQRIISKIPLIMIFLSCGCALLLVGYIWFGMLSFKQLIKVCMTYCVLMSLSGLIYKLRAGSERNVINNSGVNNERK